MVFKSGFVTVIGRPNVGKSTLINALVGDKVAITSPKPQTTRNRIQAVSSREEGQIVFVDTPGFHKARNKLDEYMLGQVYQGLDGIDLVLLLFDATSSFGKGDSYILRQVKEKGLPVIAVLNKIDRLDQERQNLRVKNYRQESALELIPISALKKKNLTKLEERIFSLLPEGPQYYPADMITDQIEQFIIAELIREKIFYLIREEIPYGIAVLIEEMEERDNGLFYIRATIYVEKKSHKGIIIGKNGLMLKEIGQGARRDIEKLLQTDVYLDLWVKILKDWRNKLGLLKRMGYKS